jgi:hypothetical protein
MKPLTSARSAARSSRTTRRPTRNLHNRLKKKNQPVVVGLKVLLVGPKVLPAGQAGPLGGLADLADLLEGLRVLPVDQAGHLEGAEDDEPRKA